MTLKNQPPVGFIVLLGRQVGFSLSPPMHNAAFAHLGLPLRYVPLSIAENDLPSAVEAIRQLDIRGANITVPYKESIIHMLDELNPEARRCGSVNTLTHVSGRLIGWSTDGVGFIRACGYYGYPLNGAHVLLLGAGGAARAVAHALVGAGIAGLTLVNRTLRRADELAESLRAAAPGPAVETAVLSALDAGMASKADIIVNATSVGRGGEASLMPASFFARHHYVMDLIYFRTPFLKAALAAGSRAHDGRAMLLFQAVESFRLWTGIPAPEEVMAGALNQASGSALDNNPRRS